MKETGQQQQSFFASLAAEARSGALGRAEPAPEPGSFLFDGRPVRVAPGDEPLFVAADVAVALGYREASDLLRRIPPDEKGSAIVRTPGGPQSVLVLREWGLYRATFYGRTERAERFRKWVVRDVLPQVQRTGRYEGSEEARREEALARFEVPRTRAEALRLAADLEERVEALSQQLAEQAPAVEAHERLLASGDTLCLRDTAKTLGIPERRLVAQLLADGVLFRSEGQRLRAYAEHEAAGRFRHRTWTSAQPAEDGHHRSGVQVRVTPEGLSWLAQRYPRAGELQ